MSCYGDDVPQSSTGSVVVYKRDSAVATTFTRVGVSFIPSDLVYGTNTNMGYGYTRYELLRVQSTTLCSSGLILIYVL